MRTLFQIFILGILAALMSGCLADREFIPPASTDKVIRNLRPGLLVINEVFPTGNDTTTEKTDWIELWNSSDSSVEIPAQRFLVADRKMASESYAAIRSYLVPPKGFFVIYFKNGGSDNDATSMLHPNASLSSSGESTAIWFVNAAGDTLLLDSLSFSASPDPTQSFGSLPDGSSQRQWLRIPSRGSSNIINSDPNGPPFPGRLVINEIAPNEAPDWVEIANPFPQDFLMKAGDWFFSDDTSQITKDTLKVDLLIPGKSYRLIECSTSGVGSGNGNVVAKFSLSSTNGESFGMYFRKQDGEIIPIGRVSFPAGISAGSSFARKPDLNGPFEISSTQSPGAANP
jgi:hypothetical protein